AERGERMIEFRCRAGIDDFELQSERTERVLDLAKQLGAAGIAEIARNTDATDARNDLPEQIDHLAAEIAGDIANPGDVSPRPRQTGHQSRAHWVSNPDHDDGNGRHRAAGGNDRRRA